MTTGTKKTHPMTGKIYPQTAFKIRQYARIIIENRCTVREAAKIAGVSPAGLHYGVALKLKRIDEVLYKQVQEVLNNNIAERGERAAEGYRQYLKKKQEESLKNSTVQRRHHIGD